MKPSLREGAVAFVRGTLVRLFASVWFAPGAKAVAAVGGVLVLAAIGSGSAHAVSTSPATAASSLAGAPAASAASAASPVSAAASPSLLAIAASAAIPSPTISTTTQPLPAAGAGPAAPAPSARATADDPVILNAATTDDLRRLPGIGPKRAEAILTLRSKLGRFHSVEDLLRVKGIGRATLRRLRPLVRVDSPALAARSP